MINLENKWEGNARLKRPPTFAWSKNSLAYGNRIIGAQSQYEIPKDLQKEISYGEEDSENKKISQLKIMAVTLNL